MSELELLLWNQTENCTVYTESEIETDKTFEI